MTFTGKAIAFFKAHSRQFEYLGMAIVGLFVLYLGINTYLKYVNKKGLEAYNVAYQAVIKKAGPQTDQEEIQKGRELFNEVIVSGEQAKLTTVSFSLQKQPVLAQWLLPLSLGIIFLAL